MDRTVCLLLTVTPDHCAVLVETTTQFTAVFNAVSAYGWQHQVRNGITLHHRLYRVLKEQYPTLVSDLHIQARAKATEALKSAFVRRWRGRPVSCPHSEICSPRYNHHTFAIDWADRTVRLSTTAGRLIIPFRLPRHGERYVGAKACTADLVRRPDGTFALHLVVDIPAPAVASTGEVVGVDFGLANPAVTSTNRFLGRRAWRGIEARCFRLRRALQRRGSKSAKRHLRRLRGRQRRFRRDCDHVLSKQVVYAAHRGDVIAVEQLTGIRARARQRRGRQNRRLHGWSFAQLKAFITYKAEERGCTVAEVSPRHTSQRCSRCGYRARTNRRSQALFQCRVCGYTLHADLNGARNIAAAYRAGPGRSGTGGLPVNQPNAGRRELAGAACKPSP
jgi:IS605 OrfB family transposase